MAKTPAQISAEWAACICGIPTCDLDCWQQTTQDIVDYLVAGIPPTGVAGGDLAGNYPNPTVFQAHLTDQAAPTPPSSGTIILASFNQQGFSVPHIYDTQGNKIEVLRDNLIIARNVTGSAMTKGQAVYVSGTTGAVPQISLAKANSLSTIGEIGIVYENIANNGYGRVLILGNIENYDLSSFSNGDILYVSPTTAGALTNVKPNSPNYPQEVGVVLNNGVGNGVLLVYTRGINIFGYNAGGDLTGTYPSPTVVWANGESTYDARYLQIANNLSDVSNTKTSRQNLGIYTIWMTNGDQTTTNGTATNITDLVFSVGVSQIWSFMGFIHIGCNNTGGVKFAITIPTGATMFFNIFGNSTTTGSSFNGNSLTSSGTLTSLAFTTANSSNGFITFGGTVTTDGTHSGSVQFQFASATAGQTSTIFKEGSFIKITPLN